MSVGPSLPCYGKNNCLCLRGRIVGLLPSTPIISFDTDHKKTYRSLWMYPTEKY